jgi:hypothetical protein
VRPRLDALPAFWIFVLLAVAILLLAILDLFLPVATRGIGTTVR